MAITIQAALKTHLDLIIDKTVDYLLGDAPVEIMQKKTVKRISETLSRQLSEAISIEIQGDTVIVYGEGGKYSIQQGQVEIVRRTANDETRLTFSKNGRRINHTDVNEKSSEAILKNTQDILNQINFLLKHKRKKGRS